MNAPRTAATVRRLHRGHFAFMRALIQGMDERAAWERYLHHEAETGDRRRIRSTIHWIRDTFAAAASRERRPGVARLVRLDAARIAQRAAPKMPSLEEFALAQGLDGFSEDEQVEAYTAAYPQGAGGRVADGGASRRARLIARQLEALHWLEHLVVCDPQPHDGLDAWLSPALAVRLRRVGIDSLAELVEMMNRDGARWWTRVPGVGMHKAARVADWLQTHAPQLKVVISEHALVSRSKLSREVLESVVSPATAIRPFEKFLVPDALDGRQGDNRDLPMVGSACPSDDREAILAWIAKRAMPAPLDGAGQGAAKLSATQRSYRKEAERLLLWSVLERGKALSSLDEQDIAAFMRFLASPPPAWCGPRANPRWSPLWRPFEGPLSPSAQRQALVTLHGLFASLVRKRYLRTNPFHAHLRGCARSSCAEPDAPLSLPRPQRRASRTIPVRG